eukprot:CAMPEP_0177640048 /NCGR_PEP_ID=MMETSP0447-20121125/6341_1 /TAXON_ID=0 /ORGANISM="Stygamoeba regulata, Strain BSH-02190019" /LENGTH=72 /DNA_ID=CAMNT_0019142105 /DNA_START=43 /DNA_END=261 /DNA_ORIENTATION=-
MAEPEKICPIKTALEEECGKQPRAASLWKQYEACSARIAKLNDDEANCAPQFMDYWHEVDKCVAPKLFQKLI